MSPALRLYIHLSPTLFCFLLSLLSIAVVSPAAATTRGGRQLQKISHGDDQNLEAEEIQGHNLRRRLYNGDDELELRVINGVTADTDRFPYYVALYRQSGSFVCGGSLVAPDMVLTAAHCNTGDLKTAVIGKHGRWSSSTDSVENREIAQVIPHPDFSTTTKTADQMILQLKKASTFPYVKYINRDSEIPSRAGTGITIIGLGVSDFKSNGIPEYLQEFTASYIPNDQCQDISTKNYSYESSIKEDHLCVGGDGGQCYGDSGGPQLLLGNSADEDIQIGVVSWGYDCGTDDLPSVGSRTSWSTFIIDTVCGLSSDPPPILCDLVVDSPDIDVASLNATDENTAVTLDDETEDLDVLQFSSLPNATTDDDP